jgi:hypothetical protein
MSLSNLKKNLKNKLAILLVAIACLCTVLFGAVGGTNGQNSGQATAIERSSGTAIVAGTNWGLDLMPPTPLPKK